MTTSVRTRFAPSPTGDLHVGNLRIAVFNHLFARGRGGAFVVRIEDTDEERNQPGGIERILEDLRWAGLAWDEGPDRDGPFGPYLQSHRALRHAEVARELAEQGLAYPCFCADEELEAVRDALRTSSGCPGGCRTLERGVASAREAGGTPAALRFAIPDDPVVVKDEIRGPISFVGKDIGDFIILRNDGRATYNFAVVLDDVDMRITHVIRGSGHLSNTPKQALIFDALGAPRPVFAHLPTVLGPDGSKLSKRTGAPGVSQLRDEGYHPDGVVNYLSLLGWSPGDDREVLSREDLIQLMDLERAGVSDTTFDPEKLRWMSGQHIAAMDLDDLSSAVEPYLDRNRFPIPAPELALAIDAIRSRLHTYGEVNEHLSLVFPSQETLEAAWTELSQEEGAAAVILNVREALHALPEWTEKTVGEAVRGVGKRIGVKGPALFHPVRLAISGDRSGPDLGKILAAVGRDRTLALLDQARERIVDGPAGSSLV